MSQQVNTGAAKVNTFQTPRTNKAKVEELLSRLENEVLLDRKLMARLRTICTERPALTVEQLVQDLGKQKLLSPHVMDHLISGKPFARLDEFILLEPLGEGGMGIVYLVTDTNLKRKGALKQILLDKTGDKERERFKREMQAAAGLDHNHLVRVYRASLDPDLYMVMERLVGDDLKKVVKAQGPLPLVKAVRCIIQAAQGLAHAHEHGIVHRDIKPANLFLTPKGVKVCDLGLVRHIGDDDSQLTGVNNILGTPWYMAPEQAKGQPADHRADIYSLFCSLYYLLVGESPFIGDNPMAQLMARHFGYNPDGNNECRPLPLFFTKTSKGNGKPPKLHELDVQFRQVFCRAMATDPKDRYQSCNEAIQALMPFANVSKTMEATSTAQSTAKDPDQTVGQELIDALGKIGEPLGFSRGARDSSKRKWSIGLISGIGAAAVLGLIVVFLALGMSSPSKEVKTKDQIHGSAEVAPPSKNEKNSLPAHRGVPRPLLSDPSKLEWLTTTNLAAWTFYSKGLNKEVLNFSNQSKSGQRLGVVDLSRAYKSQKTTLEFSDLASCDYIALYFKSKSDQGYLVNLKKISSVAYTKPMRYLPTTVLNQPVWRDTGTNQVICQIDATAVGQKEVAITTNGVKVCTFTLSEIEDLFAGFSCYWEAGHQSLTIHRFTVEELP